MKNLKKAALSAVAAATVLCAASASADYTTTFTTSNMNPYNYDGAWGPGDCGWNMLGAGGSGYGGGASYAATKDCPYSSQSMSWSYNNSWNTYTVTIRQYGEPYCAHGTETVPVTTTEEVCAAP